MPPFLFFILLLTVCFAVIFYLVRPTRTERAVQRHLESIKATESGPGEEPIPILKEEGYSPNPAVSDMVRQIPGAKETLDLIRQAGKSWSVSVVMGLVAVSMLFTAA
ncbi:MAG TPA: hypothetical protein VLW06_02015, partial [Terriglobales bacterium]|nr:hypothetical protein [Terriglobales bacterium]